MDKIKKKIFPFAIIYIIILSGISIAQNYYEKLGDYEIELIGIPEEGGFYIENNVYDLDRNKIESNFFSNDFGGYNNYEMKKFIIDKENNIEAVFILLIQRGASKIWGELYCITLKEIQNFQTLYAVSLDNFYLMYKRTHLKDLIKDIDNNGKLEIITENSFYIDDTFFGYAISYFIKIFSINNGVFELSNVDYKDYIILELKEKYSWMNDLVFDCNKDYTEEPEVINSLGSMLNSYYLIDELEKGLSLFDSYYRCSDADILKKKIYLKIINN